MTEIYDFDRQQELKAKLKEAEEKLLYWKKDFEFAVIENKKLKADLEAANDKINNAVKIIENRNEFIMFGPGMILGRIRAALTAEAEKEMRS